MKDTVNNVALGLGIVVLGFAVFRYFKGAGNSAGSAAVASNPNAGALLSALTFPMGTATGGVNMNAGFDQVYSSASWNPDAISSALTQDAYGAMNSLGMSTSNQYGFHL